MQTLINEKLISPIAVFCHVRLENCNATQVRVALKALHPEGTLA